MQKLRTAAVPLMRSSPGQNGERSMEAFTGKSKP